MKDYKLLKFLDIFKKVFEMVGIDYPILRKILSIKLLLDSRRVSTIISNQKQTEEANTDKNNFIKSLWMYLLFGAFLVVFIFIKDNYLLSMTIIFSMFMFFMMSSLISDFSSILLDLRDKEIILSKPVNSITLNAAKILHIFYYIFMITMALIGPSLITALIRHGFVFFIIYFATVILIDLFSIVATGLLYLLVLRFFDGEKLKDIINYVQIGLSIVITIGYQLIGRVFRFIDLNVTEFNPTWWKYFMPPLWFAAPFELIINGNKDTHIIIFSILAVVIPLMAIIIYIKTTPAFERNLQKLSNADGQTKNKDKLTNLIANIVCKDREERNFYKFSTNMIKNERTFKLKVYPSLGFSLVFPLIMLFANYSYDNSIELTKNTFYTIYFVAFMIPTIMGFLSYSGNYKGAWIYQTMPINNKSTIFKGAIKSVFVNLFTPVFILISIIYLFLYKYTIVLDLIIVYLNLFMLTSIVFMIQDKDLPFSLAFETTQKKNGFGELILTLISMGILLGLHYLSAKIIYGGYILISLLIILNIVIWKKAFVIKEKIVQNI